MGDQQTGVLEKRVFPRATTFGPSRNDILSALEGVFGPPAHPEKLDEYTDYHAAVYDLPSAYLGQSVLVRETLNNLITDAVENWQTTDGLPFKFIDGLTVKWDEIHFDRSILPRVPYEGASRFQTSIRRTHRDRVLRRGAAMLAESDFFRTPEGVRQFSNEVLSIKQCVQLTCNYGMLAINSRTPLPTLPQRLITIDTMDCYTPSKRWKDMDYDERLEYRRASGKRWRQRQKEKKQSRNRIDTKQAAMDRNKSKRFYHKKLEQNREATLLKGREHQRQLRSKRNGGPVGKLMKTVIKNVLRPYHQADVRIQQLQRDRERNRRRRVSDLKYTISCRLRSRFKQFTGKRKVPKKGLTYTLMGCGPQQVVDHLVTQLNVGENLSDFEIDHIFPFTSYDLTEVANQYRVMHPSNLQPLPMSDNRSKNERLPTKAMAQKVDRQQWPPGITEDMLPDIYPEWKSSLRMVNFDHTISPIPMQ